MALASAAPIVRLRGLLDPLPRHLSGAADRRRQAPCELIRREGADIPLLLRAGPVRVGAAFNLEVDDLVGDRVAPVERDASHYGTLVFLGRSLRAVVGREFGRLGIDVDDGEAAAAVEYRQPRAFRAKDINSAAVRA